MPQIADPWYATCSSFISIFWYSFTADPVLPAAEHADVLQRVDHAVDGGRADAAVFLQRLIIDLLAAGAVFLQDDI